MRRIIVTAIMALASARFIPAGYAQTLETLYSFTNQAGDGANPIAGVTMDGAGNVYGTTEYGGDAGYGTVYELSPPSSPGGAWTETVLHSFAGPPADGKFPWSSLIVANGVVYGTTENGGTGSCSAGGTLEGCGVAFSLAPPSSPGGAWTETIMHNFGVAARDGLHPLGLTLGSRGQLYGMTTQGGDSKSGGIVFRLNPPSAGRSWTETVLYRFTGSVNGNGDGFSPNGTLALSGGSLFGTTGGGGTLNGGTVFELQPPSGSGAWTENVLYSFPGATGTPANNLIIGAGGVLYGTTLFGNYAPSCYDQCGSVFQLTPPTVTGGAWSETTLYNFTGPANDDGRIPMGLAGGANGTLLGTTKYGGSGDSGIVFKLTPPTASGVSWTETVEYVFTTGGSAGFQPYGIPITGEGWIFGATLYGGASGYGSVFQLAP